METSIRMLPVDDRASESLINQWAAQGWQLVAVTRMSGPVPHDVPLERVFLQRTLSDKLVHEIGQNVARRLDEAGVPMGDVLDTPRTPDVESQWRD